MATQDRQNRSVRGETLPSSDSRRGTLSARRIARTLSVLLAAALATTVAVATPAVAVPPNDDSHTLQPSTAAEAKQAWLDAAQEAEAANEALLTAKEDERNALIALSDARIGVAQANLSAINAQAVAVQAASEYAAHREALAEFASASFRGADFGELAAVLTSDSTSEFLDKMSSLDQVAGSTRLLMIQAMQAKTAAESAEAQAAAAQDAAIAAQQRADQAVADAGEATAKVTKQKKKLDSQVEVYHRLFSALSGEERAAAMRAQQVEWERQSAEAAEAAVAATSADEITDPEQVADLVGDTDGADADGKQADSSDKGRDRAEKAVAAALSRLGLPYVYGSGGPSTFDCSGLTSWAWKQAGVTIPRTSSGQAGLKSVPLDELQPGDLVTYYSPVHHVAMYIGNGQIVHASTEGKPVFVTSLYRGGPYPTGHRVNY